MFSTSSALATSRIPRKLWCFALLLFAAVPGKAQTPVAFGDVITAPGVYFLHGNQSGSGTGITIISDDVTLLLLRFTLRGDGSAQGIHCSNFDNVTVYGGRITNFDNGILFQNNERCTVKDVRIDHCSQSGVFLRQLNDCWFLRLRTDHNGAHGIEAANVYGCRFISILAHDNAGDGILLGIYFELVGTPGGPLEGSKVRLCWAAYNGRNGIRILDSNDHELVRNQCVSNSEAGIILDATFLDPTLGASQALQGPRDNVITSNWCVFNRDGIVAESDALSNTLTNNTALASFDHDLVDDNDEPPCANAWILNFFLTKEGAGENCIF